MASYLPRSRGPRVSGKLENRLCWMVGIREGRPFSYLEKNSDLKFSQAKFLKENCALMPRDMLI
jgi:hypothetical protein